MRFPHRCFVALLAALTLGASPAAFAKPELVCPCTVTSHGQTAWAIDVGLRNTEATLTGDLRFRITLRDAADTTGAFFIGGFVNLGFGLGSEENLAAAEYNAGLVVPVAGDYVFNLELQEEQSGSFVTVDSLRFRQEAALDHVGGGSSNGSGSNNDEVGAIYLDGSVTVQSVANDEITVDLPAIVNGSTGFTTPALELHFWRTATPSVFGSTFILGSTSLGGTLAPGATLAAQTVTSPYVDAGTTGDYVHLVVVGEGGSVLAWETVQWLGGATEVRRDLTLNGIEILDDDDGDGVSNFNERFAGTEVDSASSTPGASRIDVLVKYTQGVPALYPEDSNAPMARIEHLIGFSNQVLAASGVDATLNLVGSSEVNTNELFNLSSMLDLMEAEQEGFEGLEAERLAVGADLVVLLIPYPGGALCGLANLGGQGKKGDLTNPINANLAHATVYVDCRDNVTIHEIGHVMGLTHSRIESARENDTGTFDWSVGHGVHDAFATVMANTDDFGNGSTEVNIMANPDILCDPTVDENPPHTTGDPCGVDRNDLVSGADAALSLDTVRFQVAAFRAAVGTDTDGDGLEDDVDTDDDNDGVPDTEDAFPLDDTESVDTDGDLIGNNADTDDDGDGVPDTEDAFPLDATRSALEDGFLLNLSTRGDVGTGNDVMIAGLIIRGETDVKVLIRGRGPSLNPFFNGDELQDPWLELFEGQTLLETNFSWEDHPRASEIPATEELSDTREAAIVVDLAPGAYTAILRGENDGTGIGIVEVFKID